MEGHISITSNYNYSAIYAFAISDQLETNIKSRMPPKVDVSILISKRDSTMVALYELLEEFQVLYKV